MTNSTTAIDLPAASEPSRKSGIGLWQWYAVASSAFIIFMVVTPILISLWGSFTTLSTFGAASHVGGSLSAPVAETVQSGEDLGAFDSGARRTTGNWTLNWYKYVFDVYGHTVSLSLMLAGLSILICIALGVTGGYAMVKYDFPGKNLVEEIVSLPLSLPGITVGVALIQSYGMIRGSWVIILFGHLLYTLPFMIQMVMSTLRSFDFVTLEEAAAVHGANFWQRVLFILLPNLRHAIIVGSLLVFAISMGEFNASFLLATPFNMPLPAALYDTYTNDSFQVSAAATTIFMAFVVPLLIIIQFLGGKELQKVGQAA